MPCPQQLPRASLEATWARLRGSAGAHRNRNLGQGNKCRHPHKRAHPACLSLPAGLWAALMAAMPMAAQEIKPEAALRTCKVTSKQKGTLFSQLKHVPTAHDYLYHQEKAEGFDSDQNHIDNP